MKSFQLFVAEHTRRIITNLQNPGLAKEEQRAGLAKKPETPSKIMQTHELDVSVAEIVAGGNYVFPQPVGAGRTDWCIMQCSNASASSGALLFELVGWLHAELDTHSFLSAAYYSVLGRDVDPHGLANYLPMLEAGQVTRRDLLCTLLDSEEGRQRPHYFVVIPEPSSWLAAFNITRDASIAFPRFTVKKQG